MHRRSRSHDAVLGDMDLLTEILLRLPVKTLLRLRCVSKKWRSLIADSQFCHRHTLGLCHKHKQNPNLYPSGILHQNHDDNCLSLKDADITPFTDSSNSRITRLHVYDKLDDGFYYTIKQSCNGLLLWDSTLEHLYSRPFSEETTKFLQGSSFYVSNPTTGYELLPEFSKPFLVFEPWKSPHYRIIFFAKAEDGDGNKLTTKMKMSVYSSETCSWRKVDLLPSFPNDFDYFHDGVYFNGAIHWYSLDGNSVYFDIDRLCLKDLPTIPLLPFIPEVVYFGGCGGNLHLIIARSGERARLYDIWELKGDYSGWIVRYHVDLSTIISPMIYSRVSCVVYQPPNEEEDEESMHAILVVDLNKLVSYNLKDHSLRIFYEKVDAFYLTCFQHQYFETLASIQPGYNNIL